VGGWGVGGGEARGPSWKGRIIPPAKKPRADVPRPRWVDQAETPIVMHGGYEASRGRPWFRPRGFGRGRFGRAGGNRGSRFF
jgi:hypothetical protein